MAAAFSRAAGYCTEKSEGHRRPWGAARRRRPGILLWAMLLEGDIHTGPAAQVADCDAG